MSEGTVELVRKMYEAFQGGDAERALSYFDNDVLIDATARVDGGTGRGREALATIIGQWLAGFEGWREEIEAMERIGNQVCVVALQSGRGRETGVEIQTRYAIVYEVRHEAITRMTLYLDPSDALRAIRADEAD